MEPALGAASRLIGSLVKQLSDDLVKAYIASSELGLNSTQIKRDLQFTQGLLHGAEERGVSGNPGLYGLVQQLSTKADEAEDALDELHYFLIQDQLDDTRHAVPDLGDGLRGYARHGRHALRHTVGNCLKCVSCLHDDAAVTNKLLFDRVAMSKKIKLVVEEIHSLCEDVHKLALDHNSTTSVPRNQPLIRSSIVQDKLYGRHVIFEQTIKDITSSTYHGEALYVLPIVGPGGIGKTTFIQHLYNDIRIQGHFTVKVWVSVPIDYDVLKLTQHIHSCISATKKEDNNIASEVNLSQLQISITRRLKSERFLIVLDDIWKCRSDEWKTLITPFTMGEAKGSIVLVTTRFPIIGEKVKQATTPINLPGLDPEEFLKFFQACVFDKSKLEQRYNELIDIGEEIAKKLKCSPLAAITVARLLKNQPSREYWKKVLENNDWQKQQSSDDIMPTLKISYDYLPFHLKQRFSYFSLFPKDHTFKYLEINRFWTAIGIVDSSRENKDYVEELVDYGFLVKEEVDNDLEDQCYVMHDLLHELSQSVSSQEGFNISSLSFRADEIEQSIKHLSITIEDRYDKNFKKEMAKLKSRINIGNLRTLMIFRKYDERITKILKDTFQEIEGLRVLFIVLNSPECLPKNFSKLLHLRYLKIRSTCRSEMSLPSALPIFYHLIFLDLEEWCGSSNLPRYISRLVNLRHFIADNELHSNVPEVGKIEHLEELKEFHVKKESVGFELEELGKLTDLRGELCVCNLEKVATKEEAYKANLDLMRNLKRLVLVWGTEQLAVDADVVDGLKPHDNLIELVIKDHGGVIGRPSWLFRDIPIKDLESLTLEGVAWGSLPPFKHLPYIMRLRLKNICGVRIIGPDLCAMHLKEVVFDNMPDLEKWVVEPNCHQFPMLEIIVCSDCPNFLAPPFLFECLGPCTQCIHYPSMRTLCIRGCPKLSLPPMPHTSTLGFVEVRNGLGCMSYKQKENRLHLFSYSGALAFHNLGKVESISFKSGSNIPWTELDKLTSLRALDIDGDPSMQSMAPLSNLRSLTSLKLVNCENLTSNGGFNPLITAVNLKELEVYNEENRPRCSVAADVLSEMLVAIRSKLLPAAGSYFQLERLAVDSISAVLVAPISSLLAATLRTLIFLFDELVESLSEEEEKALQLLTSLQTLSFYKCRGLSSLPQRLHSLPSLGQLNVHGCPGIRSLPNGGLPMSLQAIGLYSCSAELREQAKELEQTNPDLRLEIQD